MYIEDALGDRVWVDLEPCKDLVANMCTLFATKPFHSVSSGAGKAAVTGESGRTTVETSDPELGELGKENILSGVETAPRYVLCPTYR